MIPIKPHSIMGVYGDNVGEIANIRIDPSSHAIQVIQYAHHEIHGGSMFEAFATQTTANSDDNQTIISFRTANVAKRVHMLVYANVSGQAWLYIYEAPTIVAGGGTSTVTVFNRRRDNTTTSTILDSDSIANQADYWDETDAAGANITLGDGTIIHQELLGAGKNSFAQSRDVGERVLKPNVNYAFVLENEGASANIHHIVMTFYEHGDRT